MASKTDMNESNLNETSTDMETLGEGGVEGEVETKEIEGLDDDDEEQEEFFLISKDQQKIKVSKKQCKFSKFVMTAISGSEEKESDIPVPNVTGDILTLIVKYLTYHAENPSEPVSKEDNLTTPLKDKKLSENVKCKWDVEFIEGVAENQQQLYDLITASNYMDIESLLHLGCAKVASMIKGESLDKIKDILDPKVVNASA